MMLSEMIEQSGLTDLEVSQRAAKGGFHLSHATANMYRIHSVYMAFNMPRLRTVDAFAYALNRTAMEILAGVMEMQGRAPEGLSEHVRQAEERLLAEQGKKRKRRPIAHS